MKNTRATGLALAIAGSTFAMSGAVQSDELATSVVTDGGCEGIFFDLTALASPLDISGLESVVVGTDDVSVYYKQGSYTGFETDSAPWTLLNTSTVAGGTGTIQDLYDIDIGAGVTIPSGETYGFLIWINNAAGTTVKAIRYNTSGTTDTTENSDLRIFSGNSSCGGSNNDPFDGSSDIRGWRGAVTYAIAQPAEPVPTMPWGVLALTGILLGWLGKSRLKPGR